VTFGPFDGLMVVAEGQWYPSGSNPLLAVDTLARIFDVEINGAAYNAVAMDPRAGARRLASRLAAGGGVRVIARDVLPSDALRLPRGRSDWLLLRSDNSRYLRRQPLRRRVGRNAAFLCRSGRASALCAASG